MSKKSSPLKNATPRMKYVHMNHVMDLKRQLKEHQDNFTGDPIIHCVICGSPVETQPMKPGMCYDCYRNPQREQEATAAECERVQAWLSDNWVYIPAIPFGEES